MDRLLKGLEELPLIYYFYGALLSFVITNTIMILWGFFGHRRTVHGYSFEFQETERLMVLEQCKKLFPIENFYFHGKLFPKGALVRIVTAWEQKVEGMVVGRDETDIYCIITRKQVIAYEKEKIKEIVVLHKTARKGEKSV